MVVMGQEGTGKSTLCRLLSGSSEETHFPISKDMEYCTDKAIVRPCNWLGNGFQFLLVDTPGLKTCNDFEQQILQKLRSLDFINLFLFVLNGSNPRLDDSLVATIRYLIKLLGKPFLENHTVFQFSNWPHDKRSKEVRDKSEEFQTKELNRRLKELFHCKRNIPTVFIDAKYRSTDETEVHHFNEEITKLEKYLNDMTMYSFPKPAKNGYRGTTQMPESRFQVQPEDDYEMVSQNQL